MTRVLNRDASSTGAGLFRCCGNSSSSLRSRIFVMDCSVVIAAVLFAHVRKWSGVRVCDGVGTALAPAVSALTLGVAAIEESSAIDACASSKLYWLAGTTSELRAGSSLRTPRRRPVQLGLRKHRLAFVPALSAVDQTIRPIRPRIRRPLRAALLCLRRRRRNDQSDGQKASDVSAQKNQPESAHHTLTQSMEQKSHHFRNLGHQLSRNFDGFPQVTHSRCSSNGRSEQGNASKWASMNRNLAASSRVRLLGRYGSVAFVASGCEIDCATQGKRGAHAALTVSASGSV